MLFYGYELAVFNTSMDKIALRYGWDRSTEMGKVGIISSTMPLGSFLGCIASIYIVRFGRRKPMIILDIFSILAVLMSTISLYTVSYEWMLLVGRTIIGFCIGVNIALIPIYIKEVCPYELSGAMGTFTGAFI